MGNYNIISKYFTIHLKESYSMYKWKYIIHNHMLTENPRLFFMHFWAKDDPIKLAKALREAIDKTHSM
ncbi:DUF1259 domain-containing protein [Bacillus sp. Bva_UNVM-123]